MPVATCKISWSVASSNRTNSALLNAVRTFLVNSGNYTLVTDQITASNYFVVRSVRNTGFTGDTITAKVGISNWGNGGWGGLSYLYFDPFESWTGTTGTNGVLVNPGEDVSWPRTTPIYLDINTDLWISCDTTFILSMSRTYLVSNSTGNHSNHAGFTVPMGITCFERLTGDADPGTFYGVFGWACLADSNYNMRVPRRFDGVTGTNATMNVQTIVGRVRGANRTAINGLDETGNHVVFEFGASLPSAGRMKGKLFGVAVSTFGQDFGVGQLLPSQASPQYIVGKYSSFSTVGNATILMQTASTISQINL